MNEQWPRAARNEHRHEQRQPRVCRKPSGLHDDEGGSRRGGGPEQVRQDMQVGRADVHVAVIRMQQECHRKIDEDSCSRHRKGDARMNRMRIAQAQNGLDDDGCYDTEQDQRVDERSEYTCASVTESAVGGGGSQRQSLCRIGKAQGERINEQVACIGQQGQRSGPPASHRLNTGKSADDPERGSQAAAVGSMVRVPVRRVVFVVVVTVVGRVMGGFGVHYGTLESPPQGRKTSF